MCPRECFSLYKSLSRLVLSYKKDWSTLMHFIYFCYLLLVTNYPITKTTCYHLFQCLQRIPCWKPLIISFCSSLGSTLLLIKRTTIDRLYLWVISHQAERVLNSEVSCIQYLIGQNERKFDYINHVVKRFRFRSTRVCRHTIPLSLLCIDDPQV